MNWFTGIAAYIVIWWVVIFAVLPLGVRPAEDDVGRRAGAPKLEFCLNRYTHGATQGETFEVAKLYIVCRCSVNEFRLPGCDE